MKNTYKEIDVIEMIKSLFRLWWLILLFGISGSAISYYYSSNVAEPIYVGNTVMFIGKDPNSIAEFNYVNLEIGELLISDYRELINTRQVMKEVIQTLDLKMSSEEFRESVRVNSMEGTRFMNVVVTHEDPETAAAISNEVSDVLVDKAVEVIGTKNIQIIDRAVINKNQVKPILILDTLVGGLLGGMVIVYIIFLKYSLDNKVRSREMTIEITESPVLGITTYDKKKKNIIINNGYRPQLDEQYNFIMYNMHKFYSNNQNKVLLITSPKGNVGKFDVISNLAISFANSGKKVLIIDGDLKHVTERRFFNLSCKFGLSDVLKGRRDLLDVIQKTSSNKNLYVITSGSKLLNSTTSFENELMRSVIIQTRIIYDVILINSPPVLLYPDALVLSRLSDGIVNIVAYGETKEDDLEETFNRLKNTRSNILGTIITKVKKSQGYK